MDIAPLNHPQFVDDDPELAAYTGFTVQIVQCTDCGFGQPECLPALPNYFDRMYSLKWPADFLPSEFASETKDLIFGRILDQLERRTGSGRRTLLDVGAHAGRFVQLASKRGLEAEGVELNAQVATFAARATGLPIHRVNAHELAEQGRRYDALTMTDVLEHIPDPVAVLRKMRTVIKPRGWIAIKVPHGPAQLLKQRIRAKVPTGGRGGGVADNLIHVNQFGVRSLPLALEKAGFKNVSLEIGAPELRVAGTPFIKRLADNAAYLGAWYLGRLLPGGLRSPLAFNLQAYAQNLDAAP